MGLLWPFDLWVLIPDARSQEVSDEGAHRGVGMQSQGEGGVEGGRDGELEKVKKDSKCPE